MHEKAKKAVAVRSDSNRLCVFSYYELNNFLSSFLFMII